ncbi:MAG: LytTR family DNA-binding domain-containing protein [Flavobacteriaceae bacterium]|jgi:two-component system LytT family response regulator|nr:LytTR family transcriptional regulator [Flavobacteriaceae bacterium]MDG1028295.1 LytTR family DNA-binding domain-containing protein [Flavobacteriaceae bacterium]MDG1941018.1 LytTR family DNA-binding domain-containing protein [Flavobacteriaceae bacterium]
MTRIEKKEGVNHHNIDRLEKSIHPQRHLDFITISNIDKVNLVKKNEILFCKSSGRYTEFHLLNKTTLVASKSLGEYENQFAFKEFFRIHNSYMINLNHLVDITKKSGNYCHLADGTQLPISRRRYDKLLHYLNLN